MGITLFGVLVIFSLMISACLRQKTVISDSSTDDASAQAQADAWVLCTNEPPTERKLWPSVSNGHLGFVVHSDSVYMNGLYSGANIRSKRARIPAVTSLNISSGDLPYTKRSFCLNMAEGVYLESYNAAHWSIKLKVYAHRILTRLLVTELSWKTDGYQGDMEVVPKVNRGKDSHDVIFTNVTSNGTRRYMHGTTKEAETPASGKTPVHVYYTQIPASFHIAASAVLDRKHVVLMSVSPHQKEAECSYNKGMEMFRNGSLESSHVTRWRQVWDAGRVNIVGNQTLAAAVNSAMYYIISSVPLKEDTTWPYVGLSPAGLASNGYNGHVFWDQDTWMYPPVLILHADLGKLLVQTRTRTLNGSYEMARRNGYKGAQYVWESALTGEDVTPWKPARVYEVHVTGDVALAFKQYLMMTGDIEILNSGRMQEAIFAIAEFWKSRVTHNISRDLYEILDNMPPDEWHYPVNNSAFCNYIARQALLLPRYICTLVQCTPPMEYEEIATHMYIPFDPVLQYHPEYDGYTTKQKIKQGDVILLGYPLQMPMPKQVRYNDLRIYQNVTGDGPAMTWGNFAIGWLDMNELQAAEDMFLKQIDNKQPPFNVWTENADGSGVTNFITGQGGFLQSVLNGYVGIRMFEKQLILHCKPLPGTTALSITGLDYVGNTIDVYCDGSITRVILTKSGVPLYVRESLSQQVVKLELRKPLEVSTQKLSISTDPTLDIISPIFVE